MNRLRMNAPYAMMEKPLDFVGYYGLAHEICARVKADKTQLTDDERIVLSIIAAQSALARYIEPGHKDAEVTLNKILGILDHQELNEALSHKMQRMLQESEHRQRLAVEHVS